MKNRVLNISYLTMTVIILVCMTFTAAATSVDLPEPTDAFFVNDFANIIDSEYE